MELNTMQSNTYLRPTIVRLKGVTACTGLSRSVIYEKLNQRSHRFDPTFPKPVKLSTSAVGWFEHEIIEWLELKSQQRFTC